MDLNNLYNQYSNLKTPAYVVYEDLIENNMKVLYDIRNKTGCKILLAQKAFSTYHVYSMMSKYLCGTTASSLHEAMLGKEHFKGEVHIFSPAYRENEFDEILNTVDHIVFNSINQWNKYKKKVFSFTKITGKNISCGLRINPEFSTGEHSIYDPCCVGSRLGCTLTNLEAALSIDENVLDGIEGLHFHTLCEQNSDDLSKTLDVVLSKFGQYLDKMKWLNFGGGHHITRNDYDIPLLIECIKKVMNKNLMVYLEPGEACVLNCGFLATRVMDIVPGTINAAIVDTSAACHMPDVIEMPYRPNIIGAGIENEYMHNYILGGPTCLAGDIIGTYSFKEPLKEKDMLIFTDMALYSMVKNNTFNGINLPDIAIVNKANEIKVIKSFGYEDFKNRL